jgi:predicted TIM-barrel fold metal-dependent hydrolase
MRRLSAAALGLVALLSGYASVAAPATYYTLEDFSRVPKVDAHVHLHGRAERLMAQVVRDNFRVLTINVDYPDFPPVADQQAAAVSLRERYPDRVAFATTFTTSTFGSPGWLESAQRQIDSALEHGAVAVKIWKNIGMDLRAADGTYVMPDDPRIAPLIANLEQRGIVLLGHQAEPLNCWLPLERMTVRSDREYFTAHPQYYMARHPEMPSHEALLAARDRMLEAHPRLRFVGVHLASLEWDVDKVAAFLDRFPLAKVDVAARMVHLEYQASKDPAKVRAFMTKYQDRLLYGSDDAYGPGDADDAAVSEVHAGWIEDWRFLATSERMKSPDFDAPFTGLHLSRDVIDKIYFLNAEATFRGAWMHRGGRRAARH